MTVPALPAQDKAFLRQEPERDSVLIGDRLVYGFTLEKVPEGTAFQLPDYSAGAAEGVEQIGGWRCDTLKTNRKASDYTLEFSTCLTSFDEGEYDLPPIAVVRRTPAGGVDTLRFEGIRVSVKEMPVDTASYIPHDIRGQIKYPVTWQEVWPYILAVLAAALLVFLAWRIYLRIRDGRNKTEEKKDPAHIVALRKLDRFRGNKYWAPERQKVFYSGVTDALREYISERYAFGAMEMTTAEICSELKKTELPKELYDRVKELFEDSDYVKFAKMTFSDEENARVVPDAVRFVTSTYIPEPEEQPAAVHDAAVEEETSRKAGGDEDDERFKPKEV